MRRKIKRKNVITMREGRTSTLDKKNNKAFLIGTVEEESKITFIENEVVYKTKLKVKRKSESYDHIPIIVPIRLMSNEVVKDKNIEVFGEFRSDIQAGRKSTYFYATEIVSYEGEINTNDNNLVYFKGFLCDKPYCKIVKNQNEIAVFCIAVQRDDHKVDYIYCIVWEDDAEWLKKQRIGQKIYLYGRMQSRVFYKKIENSQEKRSIEVYEVNVLEVDKINN